MSHHWQSFIEFIVDHAFMTMEQHDEFIDDVARAIGATLIAQPQSNTLDLVFVPDTPDLKKLLVSAFVRVCAQHQQYAPGNVNELTASYISMEIYFFSESWTRARSIGGGGGTPVTDLAKITTVSPVIADGFFIVQKVVERAFHTKSADAICSVTTRVNDWLRGELRVVCDVVA